VRLQQHHVGPAARLEAIPLAMQRARTVDGDALEHRAHLGVPGHVADVQTHVRDVQHVVAAERIPRVHHAIVAAGDIHARLEQLLDARHAATLGIRIVPALQRDVDQRIGDGSDPGFVHQGDELGHVVIVHRVHRREMRARDAAVKSPADGLAREGLDVA
jgi:hypothetical protein